MLSRDEKVIIGEKRKRADAISTRRKALQNALQALYPKVADASDEEKESTAMDVESSPKEPAYAPGWHANVGGTLLHAYDKSALKIKINKLLKIIDADNKILLDVSEAILDGSSEVDVVRLEDEEEKATREGKLKRSAEVTKAVEEITNLKLSHRSAELERQYEVQRRFFDPQRCQKSVTKELAVALQDYRLSDTDDHCLDVSDHVPRRLITAERSTIEASINTLDIKKNPEDPFNQLGWIDKKDECAQLGATQFSYYQNPNSLKRPQHHTNHLGNFFMTIPHARSGSYDDILNFLLRLAKSFRKEVNKSGEQALMKLMLDYAKKGAPITLRNLKKVNAVALQSDCDQLNALCYFLFVKEICRRMPCEMEIHDIPVAIIHARAMQLVLAGHLSFYDVFRPDANYGVVTGRNIYWEHDKVMRKMHRVNRLYNQLILQTQHSQELHAFFRKHPEAQVIASRKQLRKELQETYGGASDTDGSGYTTDEVAEASVSRSP
jgi:hypothetical protein